MLFLLIFVVVVFVLIFFKVFVIEWVFVLDEDVVRFCKLFIVWFICCLFFFDIFVLRFFKYVIDIFELIVINCLGVKLYCLVRVLNFVYSLCFLMWFNVFIIDELLILLELFSILLRFIVFNLDWFCD